jgi:hypothetical protein
MSACLNSNAQVRSKAIKTNGKKIGPQIEGQTSGIPRITGVHEVP